MSRRDEAVSIRMLCGAWHPTLRHTWDVPPACKLDHGHAGPHQSNVVTDAGRRDIEWPFEESP